MTARKRRTAIARQPGFCMVCSGEITCFRLSILPAITLSFR
jgi:hypothetical protein